MATVPKEIVAGNTSYAHFPERHHDAYAPVAMLPDPPPHHTWRYCVAKAQGNTVYFSNKATGASIWVLPDLAPTEGATVVMKTIGTVDSALKRAQKGAGVVAENPAVGDTGTEGVVRSSTDGPPTKAQPPLTSGDATGPSIEVTPTVAAAGAGDATRKSIQEKLQESIRQRLAARGIQPASTIPTAPAPTGESTTPPTADAPPASAAPTTPTDSAAPSASRVSSTSPSGGGVRDRIAQWRASKGGPKTSRSTTPQHSTTPVSDSPARENSTHTSQSFVVSRVEQDAAAAGDPSPTRPMHRPTPHRSQQQHADPSPVVDAVQQDLYEEKRRQMLEADAALQHEKASLLRAERVAVERAQLAAEMRAREEENYARIVSERRRLEEERLLIDVRERERAMERIAKEEIELARREAAHAVDAFALADEEAKRREEAAKMRAATFSEAIAKSLLDHVAPRATEHKRRRDDAAAHHHASSSSSSDEGDPLHADHRYAAIREPSNDIPKKRNVGTIQYTPQLKYMGHIGGGPLPSERHAAASPSTSLLANRSTNKALLQASADQRQHQLLSAERHGTGTYLYDDVGSVRYDGHWKRDKKHGQGDMSTPTAVYEGRWRDDKIHGKGMLQTKNIKASMMAREGAAHGNAIIQAANGASYIGVVDANKITSPGALALGNGDHVEWKWTDPHARGTGECRIQFHSGDSYVGGVEHFLLHGKGAYLSAEGDEYIGDFAKGVMAGVGFFRFANGNTYEGTMRNGLFHGQGVYYSVDAYVYQGEWDEGAMHGRGRVMYRNGDVWEGMFERDARREGTYVASSVFQLPLPPS